MCRQFLDRWAVLLDAGVAKHALGLGGQTGFDSWTLDGMAAQTLEAEADVDLVVEGKRLRRRQLYVLSSDWSGSLAL